MPALTDQQNKAFILEQLMLIGDHQAMAQIATYLTDDFLADPAARALVKIGSDKAFKALQTWLSLAKRQAKLSIIATNRQLAL